MSTQNPSMAGNFESTAQRMLEALDKASAELSSSVNDCIEQLSAYNLALQKSLTDQLHQVDQKLQAYVESGSADLEKNKDSVLETLEEFGQNQVDTVAAAGLSVRQSLTSYTQQALEKISTSIENQLEELRTILDQPENEIHERNESAISALNNLASGGMERIDQKALIGEESLAQKSSELETELAEMVTSWKESIEGKVAAAQTTFSERAKEFLEKLQKSVQDSAQEVGSVADAGNASIDQAITAATAKVDTTFGAWREEISELSRLFTDSLETRKTSLESQQSSALEQKLSWAKEELNNITTDARERIKSTHKTHQSALSKLEQDYLRRLKTLVFQFDTTISETLRRSSSVSAMQQRLSSELLEKLNNQMTVRGEEICRAVKRLSEQLENEYAKSTQGLEERIEQIREASIESMAKHVQAMKSDAEKNAKSFHEELRDLEANLGQIEEAGKAAAVTVMAYRSALLSLESE